QKSFGAFKPVEKILRLIPDLGVETIESSCCGMAGAFGYGADTYQASMEMAELSLLPTVRRADTATLIVADGTSCRHQIKDGTSLMRAEIAHGKAYGALAMGMGSRALFQRAQEQAYFVGAVNALAQGRLVPVPGGVLIQGDGGLLGAVGVSGDTSDNDEICAV